ncbi:MAG TPA: serine/threonine-protein kinase, partial [Polyangiaceae bacterium]
MTADVFGLQGLVLDGAFRVEDVIGEGGFALVYRGHHIHFDIPIAIKCLKVPSHFTSEARSLFFERFRTEARMLARLAEHPNIVRAYHFGVASSARGDVPYLVLEWLSGEDLEQFSERRRRASAPMSEADAIALLRPAVSAIAMAHQMSIVHCDIKPANLFLARGQEGVRMEVLDFGIAKAMQEGELATQLATKSSTGFRAFTPSYGAPEQFFSKRFGSTGPWTDVHSLGLVLTELVSASPALDGEDHAELLQSSIAERRPTPRLRNATVTDAFEALVARAV